MIRELLSRKRFIYDWQFSFFFLCLRSIRRIIQVFTSTIRDFLIQIAELSIRHEQEKAQTLRAHQIERDSSLKEHEQEKVSKVTWLQTFIICHNV